MSIRCVPTDIRITVVGTAAYSLQQYYKTQNDTNGSLQLWSPTTMLWPTILTLIVAIVILIFNGIEIFAYCCGKARGDQVTTYQGYFMKFADTLQSTLSTIAAGVTLGTSADPNSLNNQTCSPAADAKAPSFPQINLGTICLTQVQLK